MSMRARSWYRSHTFHHSEFPPERLAAGRRHTVSVCLPARNEERTIGAIVSSLTSLREAGVLGAEVHDQSDLRPEMGPVQGKGDAMWRSLPVLTGDVICFLDADSEHFGAHFACGLLWPLLSY